MGKKYYEDPKGMRTARKFVMVLWGARLFGSAG